MHSFKRPLHTAHVVVVTIFLTCNDRPLVSMGRRSTVTMPRMEKPLYKPSDNSIDCGIRTCKRNMKISKAKATTTEKICWNVTRLGSCNTDRKKSNKMNGKMIL